jgi:hypothetical protein
MKRNRLTPRTYAEVADLVETAIACGYQRAFKHTNKPTEAAIVEYVQREVMATLADLVEWPEVRR